MKGSAPFHSFDQRVANSFVVILLSYYWLYTVWDSESSRAITIVQLRCSFSRCCPFNSRVLTNTTVVVVIMSIYGCIPLCIKVLGSLLHYGAGGDIYIYLSFTSGRSVWCKRAIAGSLPKATVENIEPLAHQPTLDRCRFDQSCILFVGVFFTYPQNESCIGFCTLCVCHVIYQTYMHASDHWYSNSCTSFQLRI